MHREDLDRLSQDLLGRPLTAAEYRDLLHTMTALQLGPGSPLAVMLILYQALRSEVSRAMEVASAHHVRIRRRRRLLSFAAGLAFAVACAAIGHATATQQSLRELDPAVRWALSEDGKRARRMSENGLLEVLDRCAIPGWALQDGTCFPGPDPASGTIRGFRTRSVP